MTWVHLRQHLVGSLVKSDKQHTKRFLTLTLVPCTLYMGGEPEGKLCTISCARACVLYFGELSLLYFGWALLLFPTRTTTTCPNAKRCTTHVKHRQQSTTHTGTGTERGKMGSVIFVAVLFALLTL